MCIAPRFTIPLAGGWPRRQSRRISPAYRLVAVPDITTTDGFDFADWLWTCLLVGAYPASKWPAILISAFL
jgi:hypothetical protein